MPDDQVCVRADLDGSLLGIHAVKLCRVLGSQFDKTLDVQAFAPEDAFREQKRESRLNARKAIRCLGEPGDPCQ
jgi:hypothetical protein